MRLQDIGMGGVTLNWFDSYITERKQVVVMGGVQSSQQTVKYGVPQGSVLGPVLFLVYINGLCDLLTSSTITYADDTVVIFKGQSWSQAFKKANLEMKTIKTWLDEAGLSLNVKKTKYMIFNISKTSQAPENFDLTIHECSDNRQCQCLSLERVKIIKYLGITIDQNLRWGDHIGLLSSKVRQLGFIFRELRNVLDPETLKMTYFTLCETVLYYGIIAWGGCAKTILQPLHVAQKCVIKTIIRKPFRFPSDLLFKEFNVLSVRLLYAKNILIYLRTKAETPSKSKQTLATRRAAGNYMNVPFMRTTFGQRHFSFIGPKMYNILPVFIKETPSQQVFKKELKKWLLGDGNTLIDIKLF